MSETRLPPLTALRAFEAAARHLSFARAAEELSVTPAALSYQIKSLEAHLGQPLFRRLNRAVELTEAGRVLRPGLADAFERMRGAVHAVGLLANTGTLSVTAGPALTAKWLAPRLFAFASAEPEIELRFVASLRLMDFDRDGIDAAIRFGKPSAEPADAYAERLCDEFVIPAAAPEVAKTVRSLDDLADLPLVHDESLAFRDRPPDWKAYLAAWDRPAGQGALPGPRFSNADHALDAAIAGAGVVLARASLAERDLAAGRLVAPLREAMVVDGTYRFVCRAGDETTPRMAAFLTWLRREMAGLATLREGFELRPGPAA